MPRAGENQRTVAGVREYHQNADVRLRKAAGVDGLSPGLLLQVHDELLFEAPEAEVAALTALAKRCDGEWAVLPVPLVVETGRAGAHGLMRIEGAQRIKGKRSMNSGCRAWIDATARAKPRLIVSRLAQLR